MKLYILTALILTVAFSCKQTTEPPPPPPPKPATITLKAEDASCTEAWLKATTTELPATVRLLRDGQRVSDLRLLTSDSLLLDEGLLPKRAYTYQLQRLANDSSVVETSASVQVTTMDTTSHNFSWQIDTLGDGSGSVLYDVAIINDTLAYAVGEMYLRDSTGQMDPLLYNFAKWNGQRWELKRVSVIYRGSLITPSLNGIFAPSGTDVWLSSGVPIHGDGQNWTQYHLFDMGILSPSDGSINKIWGNNSSDLWFVGNRGTIVHYANGTWRRLESGTTVTLNDVWGGSNRWVGENVVLVAASYKFEPGEMRIVRVNSSGLVDSLPWPMQDRRIHSVWFHQRSRVFTAGGGVFSYAGGATWNEQPIPLIFTDRLRGTSPNNAWVVGDFGIVAHFNGYTWRDFPEVRLSSGIYESVAAQDGLMIAVGFAGNRAVVLRGTR